MSCRKSAADPSLCCHAMRRFRDFDARWLPRAPRPCGGLPSEVILDPDTDPIPRRCAVNLDSVDSVSVAVLVQRLGRLAGRRLGQICDALAVVVDCDRA